MKKLIAYTPISSAGKDVMMGWLSGDTIAPLAPLGEFYADTDRWTAEGASPGAASLNLKDVKLSVPIPLTAKVICVAINYVEHGKEGGLPTPSFPNLFARWTSTLVTEGTPIPVPLSEPEGIDWEVEMAAIVGKTMLHVRAADALQGVLGYTVFNDISGRASQLESMTLSTGQWGIGKNLDASGAIGSVIALAAGVDIENTRLTATVDGQVMQDGTTADMVFTVPALIEYITRTITLNPGDLIATGTPAGVGFGRKPRVYMKPGSTVEVSVVGVASVSNPIVARA